MNILILIVAIIGGAAGLLSTYILNIFPSCNHYMESLPQNSSGHCHNQIGSFRIS